MSGSVVAIGSFRHYLTEYCPSHLANLLATSGQNGSGLFTYLILRRQRAVIVELDDASKRRQLKIQLTAGFAVMFSLFIGFSFILFLLN